MLPRELHAAETPIRARCGFGCIGKPGKFTISGKASLDIPPGTLKSVLKQAGLKE